MTTSTVTQIGSIGVGWGGSATPTDTTADINTAIRAQWKAMRGYADMALSATADRAS